MALSAGDRLGPYEIVAPIGAGGMGEVYRARDQRLGRDVAIKVLPQPDLSDLDRKRRFIQEARAASALNHPNIVTLHDIASDDGRDYIVMELVSGKSLEHVIRPKGVPVSEAANYASQIADALAAAHAAGIVHRDIKPGNVIVDSRSRVKVLDFGLAKLTSKTAGETDVTLTSDGMIVGTVAYMSPEQASGKEM